MNKKMKFFLLGTGARYEVSSLSPSDELLVNNVEHFNSKEGKNRNYRGPSVGASSPRESMRQVNIYWILYLFKEKVDGLQPFGQFNLEKAVRDKKTVRVFRQKRHLLSQRRESVGFRGPTDADFTLGARTHISSVKPTSTQATGKGGSILLV